MCERVNVCEWACGYVGNHFSLFSPLAPGCNEEHFPVDVPCVDTYRSKPDEEEPKVSRP